MKQNLEGKTAIITGAGGGIGRAAAVLLASKKMNIVLLGGKSPEKLKQTETELDRMEAHYLSLPGDLTDEIFLSRCPQMAAEHFGGIDVLINNAGIALNCPFEEVTPEQFASIMTINVTVPFFLTQKVLPYLRKSTAASIINISSVVGHAGYPNQSAYAASKHALLGFTKSLANELFKDQIRVHAICPGGVYTDMVKIARPDLTPEGMILPEEIADIILFFLENRGNAVVDEILVHRANKEPFLI